MEEPKGGWVEIFGHDDASVLAALTNAKLEGQTSALVLRDLPGGGRWEVGHYARLDLEEDLGEKLSNRVGAVAVYRFDGKELTLDHWLTLSRGR
jgi:hypothetical protein